MDDCKGRWKQLRDSFVKNKNKNVPSGSAGGSLKEWKYMNVMSFLLPHLQPRSSKSSLQPLDLGEDTAIDLSCGDDEVAGPSQLASRPGTPMTPTLRSTSSSPQPTEFGQRTATPPLHPRVQARSTGSATQLTQPGRKAKEKRRGSTSAASAEQQLFEILTAEKAPVSPHVPTDNEEMYFSP